MKIAKPLYLNIADGFEQQIKTGNLKVGDKLPSLREVTQDAGVSLATAQQSYYELENRGLVTARPKSGYYVAYSHHKFPDPPTTSSPLLTVGTEDIEDVIDAVSDNLKLSKVNLSQGTPGLELLPIAKINKSVLEAMRLLNDSGVSYSHDGSLNLKRQIAKRSLQWGGNLKALDIITTSGSMEAIAYCMMAVSKPGDTIAVESPVFYGILQLAKTLGLKVMELPTNSKTGIELPALENALKKKKINLCLLIPNFNNPLGSCMPDEHKKAAVNMLEKYNIPLIEDDIYGDLFFDNKRPLNCKTFDETGNVMLCDSFSKTLTSGHRVGWVSAGKFSEKVNRIKRYFSVSTNTLAHEAIGLFLENSRYDAHLRKLRQTLHANQLQYLRCISEYFPKHTKVSQPSGGFFLWVELHKNANMLDLYDNAIRQKISFAPGNMYTLQKQYRNCFRLSYGIQWNNKVENALKILGKLASE